MSQRFSSSVLTIPVFNGVVPANGPKATPLLLDFRSGVTEWDIDLTFLCQHGSLDQVQSVFIDNSGNAAATKVTLNGTAQVIIAPAHTQGYYALLCTNPPKLVISSTGGVLVPVFLLNFTVGGCVWATS